MKLRQMMTIMVFALLTGFYISGNQAGAQTMDYGITNYYYNTINMTTGDTGYFRPEVPVDVNTSYGTSEASSYTYTSEDPTVLSVGTDGFYQALKPSRTYVTMEGYDDNGYTVFRATFQVSIALDTTSLSLGKTRVDAYALETSSYYFDGDNSFSLDLISPYEFDSDCQNVSMSCSSSSSSIYVSVSLTGKRLFFNYGGTGSTTVTVNICGKVLTFTLRVHTVKISTNSYLLVKKNAKSLKISGYNGNITWTSSNKKVATVTSKGKVKAKKTGTTIITAKIGEIGYLGCAVSVVSSNLKKTINYGMKIGANWKYSQARRMQTGYYDCSSLVWRAYAKYGKKVASASYAPTSADMGQWCASHKKMIKGGLSANNVKKFRLRAGDLFFETGSGNGRYKGIYHVEMIAGYCVMGYDGATPMIGVKWVNRGDNYYGLPGGLVGRP